MADAIFWMRIVHLPRVLDPVRRTNNEPVETWPDPIADSGRYSARPLALNAGEEIRQGVKESTNFLKLEIKGQKIPLKAFDRIRVVASGQLFRIVGDPVRNRRTTQISCESVDPG
jgi:hypothetical protein